MTYISLKESVDRILLDFSPGDRFTTADVYHLCGHRQATKSGIAHCIKASRYARCTNENVRTTHVWERVE